MKKTVLCHFYNEEYLLPWWLKHHRKIFDHGIMIDYNSTDNSRKIIQDICPSWQIVDSQNIHFDSGLVDREVEEYERTLEGWRIALNVTEFLYGNYERMSIDNDQQIYVGNYVFASNDNVNITHDKPLHEQCTLGFLDTNDTKTLGKGDRPRRSLHNFPIKYSPGRHYAQPQTYNDLYIFYYGYAILNEQAIARKVQIRDKMSEKERKTIPSDHPNNVTSESFLNKISRNINPRSKDIAVEIEPIIKLHQTLTGERF